MAQGPEVGHIKVVIPGIFTGFSTVTCEMFKIISLNSLCMDFSNFKNRSKENLSNNLANAVALF